ncbi:MAG TPA: hypothetical protein VGN06_05775 [Gaiellaceae bacterium]|jgi:hypothetical protein
MSDGDDLRRLLLVVGEASPQTVRLALAGAPGRIHVVVPAVVRPLDWLANADERATERASLRASEAEDALSGLVEVTSEAGDLDPVQAVADALVEFPATDMVIAGASADEGLDRALARFGVPVYRVGPRPGRKARVNREVRELAGGRNAGKLLALILGMNLAVMVAAIVLSLFALLVLWLVGAY